MNLKNSGDSTGFEPMTSAMPVQCSNQLSYEVTQWRADQFVELMFSREGMSYIYIHFFRFVLFCCFFLVFYFILFLLVFFFCFLDL